jgi:acyl-CoA synthetase (AMP-forming)/AMP-acid ligase II
VKDDLHDLTLADVLRAHAGTHPDTMGAVCGEHRLTYRALDGRVNQLANALAANGVGRGDRLLWLGQNCHRLLEGLLAASKIGAVFCPANWRQSAAEFTFRDRRQRSRRGLLPGGRDRRHPGRGAP